ncbi:MAG: hypothetical protein PHU37_09950 [Methanoculleus chikugoensis]|jgi:hypothetical protein|nr:hypothetical protein [Methanoculleus chikugoensis]
MTAAPSAAAYFSRRGIPGSGNVAAAPVSGMREKKPKATVFMCRMSPPDREQAP